MNLSKANKIASIINVSKNFGKHVAVKNVSFDLYQGEVLSILGPNGAGKTTLINMMLGRLSISNGQIAMFGKQPGDIILRRQCGTMLQVSGLPDMSTVKEHIQLFRCYYPNPMPYQHVIEMVGLKSIENQYSKTLSGGQKQRLLFALSICGNPKLLFLDEPSVGMDISARKSLWQAITSLKNKGTSIILTTHYMEEADQLADRIIMINKGQIIQQGTPIQLKSQINNKTIRFISCKPITEFIFKNKLDRIEIKGTHYEIRTENVVPVMKELLTLTDDISDLSITGAALEDAFLQINKQQNIKQSA